MDSYGKVCQDTVYTVHTCMHVCVCVANIMTDRC